MGTDKPDEASCSELLNEVWLLIDHECDQQRRALLEKHLNNCHPCLERYGIEEHLKQLLHRKCGGDQAPDAFKQRLRETIREAMRVVAADPAAADQRRKIEVEDKE